MSNKFEVVIMADTNDGDYVHSMHVLTQAEIDYIMPMIEAIKNFKPYVGSKPNYWGHKFDHNYCDRPREDLGERTIDDIYSYVNPDIRLAFAELVPYSAIGVHTIEAITMTPFVQKVTLL